MDVVKYLALDVHIATITILVMSVAGRVLLERTIATSAAELRKFFHQLRGQLIVTFEEGTLSQWLYEIIQPLAHQVIVCNPRRNKLLEEGNKGDRIDTRKLADLLRSGMLKPVYHGPGRGGLLKELVGFYIGVVSDTTRIMSRLKAVYRSRGIQSGGRSVYYQKSRQQWLAKLDHRPEKRQRAEMLYRQLDFLRELRREAKKKMLATARAEKAYNILISIPGLGPIRVAILLAIIVTPFRFRSKRQLWKYSGLSVVTRSSSDYVALPGGMKRVRRQTDTRGLTPDFNHLLKYVLKGAASEAIRKDPFQSFYRIRINKGIAASLARLTVARKIAGIVLTLWKKGVVFDQKVMMLEKITA
jgi:transposase